MEVELTLTIFSLTSWGREGENGGGPLRAVNAFYERFGSI